MTTAHDHDTARDNNAAQFGSSLVAMVTPMRPDGRVSQDAVTRLIDYLLAAGCDGLVVAGTTGESPTLTPAETAELIATVAQHARGRARVIAGVGTNDTAHSAGQARQAEDAGADALLLVAPYYSRPTQAGVVAHGLAVADATALPVMLYDVPHRTGTQFSAATLIELARHPRVRAVKDAKGDLFEAVSVMAETGLAYYCGIDELNLPYLAAGASGVVSVVANAAPAQITELIQAVRRADLPRARAINRSLVPLIDAIMRTSQGPIMAKAALAELAILDHATVRLPLLESPPEDLDKLRLALPGPPAAA
ncbi:MAG: 4-hydroxy-tetrahydrodipicolinate synthase [Nocardiopsaceae bacterium]|nr:4-hydroxy-tetrahydrodipicolinate synthase [Nocardiopsaceae bacterium]